MTQITAPYRFVPLSSFVFLPNWADQASQDMPFADGVCGELRLKLTCHTPTCVGGKQDGSTSNAPGKVHFFRDPDGNLAIPGSNIQGMLRNVLEIASFARFRQVEDQKLGVRDISESNNFYTREMVKNPVHAGWLTFTDGNWKIQPCEFSRLYQGDLIAFRNVPKLDWIRLKKAKERYERIGICPEIQFNQEPMPKKAGQSLAKPSSSGSCHGWIVVTGQPGKNFEEPKAKKYEFIFHDAKEECLTVCVDTMNGFRQIHENSEEWSFWQTKLQDKTLPMGIPVFFHQKGTEVTSLGLAMMYKLPYINSLHDAIKHTSATHIQSTRPDLADLVFGFLGEDDHTGLRGRVNIGLAKLATDSPANTHWTDATVLSSPKPTFYPAYIRQTGKNSSFRQLMEPHSELSGWKRYPVKNEDILPPPEKSKSNFQVQVKLEVIEANAELYFTIRLHNMRHVELGALLWALDFGDMASLRHSIGMGKPYGLGQISLSIIGSSLRHNNVSTMIDNNVDFLGACRREFSDIMNQTLAHAGISGTWEKSEPIKALQDMATPNSSGSHLQYLPVPKDFMDLRKAQFINDFIWTFHSSKGLNPSPKYNPEAPVAYESQFEQHLEEAPKHRQAAEEKAARESLKRNASAEDLLLITICDLLEQSKTTVTPTIKDNINKHLRDVFEKELNDEQKTRLREYAKLAQSFRDKRISKIANKILDKS
jgi:CRISPR-associated protein (TIGR03986 family)